MTTDHTDTNPADQPAGRDTEHRTALLALPCPRYRATLALPADDTEQAHKLIDSHVVSMLCSHPYIGAVEDITIIDVTNTDHNTPHGPVIILGDDVVAAISEWDTDTDDEITINLQQAYITCAICEALEAQLSTWLFTYNELSFTATLATDAAIAKVNYARYLCASFAATESVDASKLPPVIYAGFIRDAETNPRIETITETVYTGGER